MINFSETFFCFTFDKMYYVLTTNLALDPCSIKSLNALVSGSVHGETPIYVS